MTAPLSDSKGAAIDEILAGILKFINSNGRDGLDIYDARELLLAWRDKAVVAELEKAHRAGNTTDYDNVTDEYIDDRLEQLGAKDE